MPVGFLSVLLWTGIERAFQLRGWGQRGRPSIHIAKFTFRAGHDRLFSWLGDWLLHLGALLSWNPVDRLVGCFKSFLVFG